MKKLLTFAFAAAFAFTATAASAATVEELQAQIDALLAQLSEMSSTTSTTTSGYTFNNDLTIGSEGADVIALQSFLESKGVLMVPAGVSKGYFGTLTQAALASYQAMVGIAPASGYFGPITRANVNASAVVTTPGTTTTTTSTNSGLSGGEASLEDFDLDREDDAEEGEMTHVATIEFDVEDGDVNVNRIDVTFDNTTVLGTADDEPWDVFETIYLAIDGDVIAEEDIDDEDDWLDDDNDPLSVFRISDIDLMIEEDDQAEIEIWLDTSNNVDDPANADWEIFIDTDGVRAVDGEGIQNYIGDGTVVSFGIDEEGGDEEIKIKSSSSDPDASTLEVDDNDDSEWFEVFVFALEAEENDIDIDSLELTVDVAGDVYDDVVSDIRVVIDGDEFDDVDVDFGGTASADLTFDIDKDATVDADDTVKVSVEIEFKQLTGNYPLGQTVQVTATKVDGEGVDDVSDTATLSSEEHNLNLAVAEVDADVDVSKSEDDSTGYISYLVTVDASDADEDIVFDATTDVVFTTSGGTATVTSSLDRVSGDALFEVVPASNDWTVAEGDDAVFALDITITADTLGVDNGTYRAELVSFAGVTLELVSGSVGLSF